ncbi:MAG: hypothetical protein NTW08_00680 [Gammaproteobacteria bacterium]|nr:hypothetical protein [Gammaproteobacteria bacterium]
MPTLIDNLFNIPESDSADIQDKKEGLKQAINRLGASKAREAILNLKVDFLEEIYKIELQAYEVQVKKVINKRYNQKVNTLGERVNNLVLLIREQQEKIKQEKQKQAQYETEIKNRNPETARLITEVEETSLIGMSTALHMAQELNVEKSREKSRQVAGTHFRHPAWRNVSTVDKENKNKVNLSGSPSADTYKRWIVKVCQAVEEVEQLQAQLTEALLHQWPAHLGDVSAHFKTERDVITAQLKEIDATKEDLNKTLTDIQKSIKILETKLHLTPEEKKNLGDTSVNINLVKELAVKYQEHDRIIDKIRAEEARAYPLHIELEQFTGLRKPPQLEDTEALNPLHPKVYELHAEPSLLKLERMSSDDKTALKRSLTELNEAIKKLNLLHHDVFLMRSISGQVNEAKIEQFNQAMGEVESASKDCTQLQTTYDNLYDSMIKKYSATVRENVKIIAAPIMLFFTPINAAILKFNKAHQYCTDLQNEYLSLESDASCNTQYRLELAAEWVRAYRQYEEANVALQRAQADYEDHNDRLEKIIPLTPSAPKLTKEETEINSLIDKMGNAMALYDINQRAITTAKGHLDLEEQRLVIRKAQISRAGLFDPECRALKTRIKTCKKVLQQAEINAAECEQEFSKHQIALSLIQQSGSAMTKADRLILVASDAKNPSRNDRNLAIDLLRFKQMTPEVLEAACPAELTKQQKKWQKFWISLQDAIKNYEFEKTQDNYENLVDACGNFDKETQTYLKAHQAYYAKINPTKGPVDEWKATPQAFMAKMLVTPSSVAGDINLPEMMKKPLQEMTAIIIDYRVAKSLESEAACHLPLTKTLLAIRDKQLKDKTQKEIKQDIARNDILLEIKHWEQQDAAAKAAMSRAEEGLVKVRKAFDEGNVALIRQGGTPVEKGGIEKALNAFLNHDETLQKEANLLTQQDSSFVVLHDSVLEGFDKTNATFKKLEEKFNVLKELRSMYACTETRENREKFNQAKADYQDVVEKFSVSFKNMIDLKGSIEDILADQLLKKEVRDLNARTTPLLEAEKTFLEAYVHLERLLAGEIAVQPKEQPIQAFNQARAVWKEARVAHETVKEGDRKVATFNEELDSADDVKVQLRLRILQERMNPSEANADLLNVLIKQMEEKIADYGSEQFNDLARDANTDPKKAILLSYAQKFRKECQPLLDKYDRLVPRRAESVKSGDSFSPRSPVHQSPRSRELASEVLYSEFEAALKHTSTQAHKVELCLARLPINRDSQQVREQIEDVLNEIKSLNRITKERFSALSPGERHRLLTIVDRVTDECTRCLEQYDELTTVVGYVPEHAPRTLSPAPSATSPVGHSSSVASQEKEQAVTLVMLRTLFDKTVTIYKSIPNQTPSTQQYFRLNGGAKLFEELKNMNAILNGTVEDIKGVYERVWVLQDRATQVKKDCVVNRAEELLKAIEGTSSLPQVERPKVEGLKLLLKAESLNVNLISEQTTGLEKILSDNTPKRIPVSQLRGPPPWRMV